MNANNPSFELLKPWTLIDQGQAKPLEAELAREMRPDHILSGIKCEAVAMSTMNDDVLYYTNSPRGSLALVHLTWSGKPDQFPNYPSTHLFQSWDSLRDEEMIPLHKDLTE